MINPSIEQIEKHYSELIEQLNDHEHDLELVRMKCAALSTLLYTKFSILENETVDNPKEKLKKNKIINALKAAHEPLSFRTFTATFQEIKEAASKSHKAFEERAKST